jgi:tripartite-type tricarboxylate transporter receptor subunit TctC
MKQLLCAAALMAALATTSAPAEPWPARPLRAIVPFTAGSATDIIPRIVLDQIASQLGQPIIVENRVGASGTIGAGAVAKAEPDGYTLLAISGAHTITPWTVANIPYDAANDFVAVAPLANLPNVLVIAPDKGIKTARELAEFGRAHPGKLTFASAGAGSATHLNGEMFCQSAGIQAVHIPFKGGPEALTEVMTGRVDFYFVPALPALPLIRDGKLVALAVSSSKRASALPDVPTTVEAGFPNSDYNFWVGLFLPAKTSRDIVDKLNAEAQKALRSDPVKEKLAKLGADPMFMAPAEWDAAVRKEIAAMEGVVKAAGLKVQ